MTIIRSETGNSGAKEPTISDAATEPLAFLDTRPTQDAGDELLDSVLQALKGMTDDGVLKILAQTVPGDLLEELARRGFRASARTAQDSTWEIEVLCANTPDIEDLRDLEAPEPMHHVLLATSRLDDNQTYYARLPHVPRPLFPLLAERQLRWWVHEEADQSALLAVRAMN